VHSLFLNPQSGVGPSISSSVFQCSVFLLFCISVPVLAVYSCPSSVRVVATVSGTIYHYYYLLQLSFQSVAVVLTLVTNKNKYTQKKQYKNTVNTITHITKTPTHHIKTPTHYIRHNKCERNI